MRALWRPGTKAHTGAHLSLPETTGYPRPVGSPQIILGGLFILYRRHNPHNHFNGESSDELSMKLG